MAPILAQLSLHWCPGLVGGQAGNQAPGGRNTKVITHELGLSSISTSGCRLRLLPEREEKGCSLADICLGPDPTVVAGDDPLDSGETDTGTGELLARVEALKGSE